MTRYVACNRSAVGGSDAGAGAETGSTKRRPRVALALPLSFVLMVGLMSPVVAAPTADLPVDVPSVALSAEPTGPVIAAGKIRGARSGEARVAAFLWPSAEMAKTLEVGDAFILPLIGWSAVRPDGSFSIPADPSRISAPFVGADGQLNLYLMAWDAASQGSLAVSTAKATSTPQTDAQESVATASGDRATLGRAPGSVLLELNETKKTARSTASSTSMSLAAVSSGPPPVDMSGCQWTKVGSYNTYSREAEVWPRVMQWGATIGSNHKQTVGVAMNASASFGSFKQSGSYTIGSGVSVTNNPSYNAYKYYSEIQYTNYKEQCLAWDWSLYTLKWASTPDFPTGGGGAYANSPRPTNTAYCTTYSFGSSGGTWKRSSNGAGTTSLSAGVETKAVLGINLGLTTNFESTSGYERDISGSISKAATVKLCGDNAKPSASNIVYEP